MSFHNVRYAIRILARNPGFASAAILCLALGIGATSAIFSVVNAVLLRPLPYANSHELVRIFTEFPKFPNGGLRHFSVSPPEYLDLKRDTKSWQAIEAWANGGVNLAGESEPVRATASFVTGGMLDMLGIQPLMGRLLSPHDDVVGTPQVAVISYGLWQKAYGDDPHVLGRDIRLNGKPCTVVGVMSKSFDFPPGEANPPELWTPLQIDPAKPGGRGSHFLSLLGRLKPGVTFTQADDEMKRLVAHEGQINARNYHGFSPTDHPIVLAGFQDEVVRAIRPAMLVLLGAVAFVLLIGCVNVANLLLARAETRRREIAIRKAIGAGVGGLIGQFITEGVLLSVAGAAVGLALAFAGLRLIVLTNAGTIPRIAEISIDWRVLLVTLAVSLITGIAFGLAPLMHVIAQDLHETLKAASGRTTAHAASGHFRSALVVAELALALVLLIGTGLMIRAFWKLQDVNTGLDAHNVLTMRVALPPSSYPDATSIQEFWSNIRARVAALPGVTSVALSTSLPPQRPINANDTQIEGFVPVPGGPIQNIDYWNTVSSGYCDTLGIRVIDGRCLDDRDGANAPSTAMINQTMARTYWGNQSAIGHRIRPGFQDPWRTIVGVVTDVKNAGLDRPTGTELYFPAQQLVKNQLGGGLFIILRSSGDPTRLVGAVRSEIRALDASVPVSAVHTMDDLLAASRSRPRFITLLLTLFSAVSLILAALGIYGVISYSVAQRTGEIGLRMAMGAQTGHVLKLVLGQGIVLAAVGLAVGAAGAIALTRFLRGLLFGISSLDLATFASMALLLVAVTLFACYVPARRATKVDPMIALRYE